jgi:3-phenylpropionate/cinnamic acid dioxygenase small subunit
VSEGESVVLRAEQVLYAYARAVDEFDIDALRALGTEDIKVTRSGDAREGVESFLDIYRALAASTVEGCKHFISNVQAEREDDGTITARAYFHAVLFDPDGTRWTIGQYRDTLVEDDGVLKLGHKRISVERVVALPAGSTEWVGVGVKS